MFVHSTDKY